MGLRLVLVAIVMAAMAPAFAQETSSSASSASPELNGEPPAPALSLSDADLELAVRTAYSAASGYAMTHGNYFARDGVTLPVRDAIAAAILGAYPTVEVAATVAVDPGASKVCRSSSGTELRIGTNSIGDGITLVAVTNMRAFSYHYDPHEAADIVVVPAGPCGTP